MSMVDRNKLKALLFTSWSYLVIAMVSVGYLATTIFVFGESGRSWDEIISQGSTYLLLGVVLTRLFTNQGTMNGLRDERFLGTVTLHGQTVAQVEPYMDTLDDWCASKTREARREARLRILATAGMKYEQFFTEDGEARGFIPLPLPAEYAAATGDPLSLALYKRSARRRHTKENKFRRRCYYTALRVRIRPLVSTHLTNSGMTHNDQPFDFGPSLRRATARMTYEAIPLRILSTVIFSYYGLKLSQDFTWQEFFIRLSQLSIILGIGVVSMYRARMYVVDEHRGNIIKKIDYLKMFWASACKRAAVVVEASAVPAAEAVRAATIPARQVSAGVRENEKMNGEDG